MVEISIIKDFTDTPGARYYSDGDFSGQEFYETLLEPKFQECKKKNEKLLIDLDGAWGYASSFISGSFGLLSEKFGSDEVLSVLIFKSDDEPNLIDEIKKIIISPEARS